MIGLGSYAFLWRHKAGMTLPDALRETHALGVGVFQVCDFEPIESMSLDELGGIRSLADRLDIRLELGTRGLGTAHLRRYLAIASALGATLLRSMVDVGVAEAHALLAEIVAELEAAGVTLALETYEKLPTRDLVALVERAASPWVGVCLDPANTVAALENPDDVIEMTAPWVKNIHVKDFAFSRRDGWVGFTLEGTRLGKGQLDLGHLAAVTKPDVNQIIEHWLPWQGDTGATIALEKSWTESNLTYLRSNLHDK